MFEDPAVMRTVEGQPSRKVRQTHFDWEAIPKTSLQVVPVLDS